jgi:hypothetical protein
MALRDRIRCSIVSLCACDLAQNKGRSHVNSKLNLKDCMLTACSLRIWVKRIMQYRTISYVVDCISALCMALRDRIRCSVVSLCACDLAQNNIYIYSTAYIHIGHHSMSWIFFLFLIGHLFWARSDLAYVVDCISALCMALRDRIRCSVVSLCACDLAQHPHWTSLHELDILSFSNWTLVLS